MHCVFVRGNIQSIILYLLQSTGEHLAGGDLADWKKRMKERNEIWRPFEGGVFLIKQFSIWIMYAAPRDELDACDCLV